jgi:8-oxo-dGTP diphosphatase
VTKDDRRYPPRPILAVLAVVRRGERILLAQRAVPPGIGKWGFPGGAVELGETLRECARRELLEETGIRAAPVETIAMFDTIRRDEAGAVESHFVLAAVLCRWEAGEGAPLEDASAVAWLTVEEATARDTFPNAVPVMRLALGRPPTSPSPPLGAERAG